MVKHERYCTVPDCDEQPWPDDDMCQTHMEELEHERAAEVASVKKLCDELLEFANRIQRNQP